MLSECLCTCVRVPDLAPMGGTIPRKGEAIKICELKALVVLPYLYLES
jgi:hypothetical protein